MHGVGVMLLSDDKLFCGRVDNDKPREVGDIWQRFAIREHLDYTHLLRVQGNFLGAFVFVNLLYDLSAEGCDVCL